MYGVVIAGATLYQEVQLHTHCTHLEQEKGLRRTERIQLFQLIKMR